MAFRRFRKRRRGGVWLPIDGTLYSQGIANEIGADVENSRCTEICTDATDPGAIIWDATHVTFDYTNDALSGGTNPTLHELVQGNEYRLLRAVGKIFCSIGTSGGTPTAGTRLPGVHAGSGLIVVRTDDQGVPTTDFNFVNPLTNDSAEDPWIWRRTWLLGTTPDIHQAYDQFNNADIAYRDWPSWNWAYGSVLDGPHLDAKTRRHIHRSERLFWVNAVRGTTGRLCNELSTTFEPVCVDFLMNVRLFGSIVPASKGNRGNASR